MTVLCLRAKHRSGDPLLPRLLALPASSRLVSKGMSGLTLKFLKWRRRKVFYNFDATSTSRPSSGTFQFCRQKKRRSFGRLGRSFRPNWTRYIIFNFVAPLFWEKELTASSMQFYRNYFEQTILWLLLWTCLVTYWKPFVRKIDTKTSTITC
jgi:hypothetical protein